VHESALDLHDHVLQDRAVGAVLCLVSAAAFGAMAVFGKLAYDEGVTVLTLLAVRFALAALLLAPVAAARLHRGPRRPPWRGVVAAVLLGAVGYALQAGLFFAALERMDASLLALVLYTYPAMVTLAEYALGRERPDRRRTGALAVASAGLVLVLGGAASGTLDIIAVALGLGAAATYTTYILLADRTVSELDPIVLSALVAGGAATTFAVISSVTGRLDLTLSGQAWLWLSCIAVISTALAVVCFFAGLARMGPVSAAILSTFEPVATVALAYAAFGERLTPVQAVGAALVLGAVIALQRPAFTRLRRRPTKPAGPGVDRRVATWTCTMTSHGEPCVRDRCGTEEGSPTPPPVVTSLHPAPARQRPAS
jgi:drug/metabolite transporter (DMT)-like permease